jgi:hypothetical protein
MKNFIKQLLRENLQLADKFYFKDGKLSPRVREIILQITNGDPYTKIMTDIYYTMLMDNHRTGSWALKQLDPKHQETEKPENDVMNIDDLKKLRPLYNQLKEYNKNVFPIKGFNINGVQNTNDLIRALIQREKILNIFNEWPSIAKRNMKGDIKTERDSSEMNHYRDMLESADGYLSQLNNRNEEARRSILAKIFTSNTTLDNVMDFLYNKESLLGGVDMTRKQIGQILKQDKQNADELKVKYNKGNVMIIEVSGPEGIKEIGCNSLWCFTYNRKGGTTNWDDWYKNSTNGYCYIIIDFSYPSDSEDFMHVLTKPLMYDYSDYGGDAERLYNMANRDMGDNSYEDEIYDSYINRMIETYLDLPTAMKIMNFGVKQPKEKKKKQKFVDPNQLSLELTEVKKNIKNILRENLVTEGVSDITYHFNHVGRTNKILETNKINLSAAFGTSADNINNNAKLFFLSTTSSRSSDVGFAASLSKNNLVRLTLNGRLLKQNYQFKRVDYWQRPKDPRHPMYNPHGDATTGKSFYRRISRQDELEDRIISDKDEIKPANKYILAIEVIGSTPEEVKHTKFLCDKLGIPFYLYDNEAYFDASNKTKAIDVDGGENSNGEADREYYINTDLIAYLGFKDDDLKQKIYDDLTKMGVENMENVIKAVETRINEKLNYYLRVNDSYYVNDFANSMSSNVHNGRSSTNNIERYLIKQLGLDMKRNNVVSIKDYLVYKIMKGKKTQKDYNIELNTKISNFIDTSLKENLSYVNFTENKSIEVNDVYYDNILQYPPIINFLKTFVLNLKQYCSNYILNNNDLFRYDYVLSKSYFIDELGLSKEHIKKELNPIINDIYFNGGNISSDDFITVIYYVLSDLDTYRYDEVRKIWEEDRNQWNT